MRYRALFVGGILNGQERVVDSLPKPVIQVGLGLRSKKSVFYEMVLEYSYREGRVPTLIYSLFDLDETLDRLWSRYAGEDHA